MDQACVANAAQQRPTSHSSKQHPTRGNFSQTRSCYENQGCGRPKPPVEAKTLKNHQQGGQSLRRLFRGRHNPLNAVTSCIPQGYAREAQSFLTFHDRQSHTHGAKQEGCYPSVENDLSRQKPPNSAAVAVIIQSRATAACRSSERCSHQHFFKPILGSHSHEPKASTGLTGSERPLVTQSKSMQRVKMLTVGRSHLSFADFCAQHPVSSQGCCTKAATRR